MITPFGIAAPRRISFGRGCAAQAPEMIAQLGRRILVVHGRKGRRAEWLTAGLKAHDLEIATCTTPGEPSLVRLESALDEARSFRPDVIVALGGGSTIDLGKALSALLPQPGAPLDYLEVVGKSQPLAETPLTFVAIPTTSGTGAEATKNAVIGIPSKRRKVSLRDDRMLAHIAIVDPALTDDTPRNVTLASGLDALTQVIEPYLCTRANPFTDALARPAIPTALAALAALMEGEYDTARDSMAWVSLCGGLALANAGLGAVHGLAGVIGGVTGAPHGAICGALLPHVLRLHGAHLSPASPEGARLAEVQRWLSATFGSEDGVAALEHWMHRHGLARLSAMGLMPSDHQTVAEAAVVSSSMKADPTQADRETLVQVLAAAG